MRLKDKVAIVSGGASGMGQSEAMLFAREGAKVIVADVLETEGRQTADKITAGGGQAKFVKLDVTSEANWQSRPRCRPSASSTSSSTMPASAAPSIPTC
jgi:NAD(P)-dependent dehydrogenase (short-subunit alcohol dehydrogenase family)